MKIFGIVDEQSNWYPAHAMATLKKYTTLEFVDSPAAADLIWIFSYYASLDSVMSAPARALSRLSPRSAFRVARRRGSVAGTPIIASFHHLDHSKEPGYLPRLKAIDRLTDYVHFFSRVNVEENERYFSKPILLLPYWIDLERFGPVTAERKLALRQALGLPADRVLVGSFQRDTESDGETPKLVKGPDVFCDVVERLDPGVFFPVLAGPRREYIERRLGARGIPFKSLGHVPYERMNDLYGCLDYYLVTSRCEGGPQAILEAMATKVKILSTRVGVSDLLREEAVVTGDVTTQFVKLLHSPYPSGVLDEHAARITQYDCRIVAPLYERTFEQLCQ